MTRDQQLTDLVRKPTRRDLTNLQNALRDRQQRTYPEITNFLREKRATERAQRGLSLMVG